MTFIELGVFTLKTWNFGHFLGKSSNFEEMMITVVGIGPEGLKIEQQFDDITKLGSLEQCT